MRGGSGRSPASAMGRLSSASPPTTAKRMRRLPGSMARASRQWERTRNSRLGRRKQHSLLGLRPEGQGGRPVEGRHRGFAAQRSGTGTESVDGCIVLPGRSGALGMFLSHLPDAVRSLQQKVQVLSAQHSCYTECGVAVQSLEVSRGLGARIRRDDKRTGGHRQASRAVEHQGRLLVLPQLSGPVAKSAALPLPRPRRPTSATKPRRRPVRQGGSEPHRRGLGGSPADWDSTRTKTPRYTGVCLSGPVGRESGGRAKTSRFALTPSRGVF